MGRILCFRGASRVPPGRGRSARSGPALPAAAPPPVSASRVSGPASPPRGPPARGTVRGRPSGSAARRERVPFKRRVIRRLFNVEVLHNIRGAIDMKHSNSRDPYRPVRIFHANSIRHSIGMILGRCSMEGRNPASNCEYIHIRTAWAMAWGACLARRFSLRRLTPCWGPIQCEDEMSPGGP